MAYPKGKLPFEDLTTIDERVDFIHDQVTETQLALNTLLTKAGEPTMGVTTKDVNLRQAVAPLTGVRVSGTSPLKGRIVQLVVHFPAGCNALVDVAVGHKDTWILPHLVDTYIALNDATPVIAVEEPIEKGEEIWMIVRNGDGANPHTISVTAVIVGVE